jgi:hypothetical protein
MEAAVIGSEPSRGGGGLSRERRFFFAMALACAAPLVFGFGLQFALGRSRIDSPWWVHVHGMTYTAWLFFYLVQNWLVSRGDVRTHRVLGIAGAFYVGWMVVIGPLVTVMAVMHHRVPFFFETNVFLVMDMFNITGAAGMIWGAVALRDRPAWHKRLMLCAMIFLTGPGWGRFLPLPLVGTWMLWLVFAPQLILLGVAMWWDRREYGRVHRAYWVGGTVMFVLTALMRPIAFTPPIVALTATLAG